MNNLAILPYICLHALQIQNVKRDVVKKVSINELNNKEIIYPVDREDINQENTQTTSHHVENTSTSQELSSTNQGWPSTSIDDLPQPASIDNNIGAEL
jgi:hypothetical protein